MKLTVIGSTGRTGHHILTQAAARGHDVTAFTQRPHLLPDPSTLAAVVVGNGRDPEKVRTAIAGADAVIAVIAASSRNGPHHTAQVSRVITSEMAELGVRRLVITSAYPIVADRPRLPMMILRRVFATAYADARAMEAQVCATDLDWTIARLNRLTDQPATGRVRVRRELIDRPSPLARADVAATLLDLATTNRHHQSAVNIAGP
jgi:putative NADH-flavin reductase